MKPGSEEEYYQSDTEKMRGFLGFGSLILPPKWGRLALKPAKGCTFIFHKYQVSLVRPRLTDS